MDVGLVALLRLTWVAAILPIILASLRLRPFHQTILGLAKRGKTMHPSSSVKVHSSSEILLSFLHGGYPVDNPFATHHMAICMHCWLNLINHLCIAQIPQGMACCVPALVDGSSSLETPLRVIICIPLSALSSNAHIRLFHWHEANTYFCMASYYIVAPLSLCCTCALEVFEFTLDLVSEGRKQWQPLEVIGGNRFPLWLGWKQWVGSAIFLWGWIHQLRCHAILVS
ncbi:hypothetical protein Goarm_019174 [Gossypium armourianum]|uniref:Polyprenol reductase n=2 Tax=Gossypium TaxID=3633 RepID=A0A7J9IJS4_9ROSI|nr:hypothetical protein [Gossypium armourianum]